MAYIYKNGAWTDYEPPKYGVNTVSFTSYPFTLKSKTSPVTATIYGNMQQSGTPTPAAPIYPTETGDKTGNLLNADTYYASYKSGNSYTATTSQFNTTIISPFTTSDIGKTYTISCDITDISSTNVRWLATIDGVNINGDGRSSAGQIKLTFTVATANDNIRITYGSGDSSLTITKIIMNEGSTALPYEPYGYKIPILSGGTTTNVYLGEVQSTRRIKKYEFTGNESSWIVAGIGADACFRMDVADYLYELSNICVGSHYQSQTNVARVTEISDKHIAFYANQTNIYRAVYIKDTTYTTVEDFKAYLAQQYAAGTPVTIWYALATPTTGIVNEPIRKISDYSDSVTASIPVIVGSDTVDIDTTLKPSAVAAPSLSWGSGEDYKYSGGSWG